MMLVNTTTGVAVREFQTERNIALAKAYIKEGLLDDFHLEDIKEYLYRINRELLTNEDCF